MSEIKRVIVSIEGDTKQLESTIDKLKHLGKVDDENVQKFQKNSQKHQGALKETGGEIGRLEQKIRNLGERLIAIFAVERIFQFVSESVKAFEEAEMASNKLEFAITKINGGTQESFKRLIEQSEKLSQSLNNLYTPKQIQQAQTQLSQFGLTTKEIEKLTPRIIDFAKVLQISLPEAANTAIRALGGQATRGELKLLGASFKDTGTITGNFNKLLEETEKISGAAAGSLDTFASKSQEASNQVEILQEKIGKELAPAWEGIKIGALNFIETIEDGIYQLYGFISASENFRQSSAKYNDEQEKGTQIAYDNFKKQFDNKTLTYERLDAIKKIYEQDLKQERIDLNKLVIGSAESHQKMKEIESTEQLLKAIEKLNAEKNKESEKRKEDKTLGGQQKAIEEQKKLLELQKKYREELNKMNETLSEEEIKSQIELIKDETEKKIKQTDLDFNKQKHIRQKNIDELTEITKKGTKEEREKAEKLIAKYNKDEEFFEQIHQDKILNIIKESNKKKKEEHEKNLDKERSFIEETTQTTINTMKDGVEKQKLNEELSYQIKKEKAKKEFNEGIITKKEYDERLQALSKENAKNLSNINKKSQKEQLEQIKEFTNQVIEQYVSVLERNVKIIDHQEQLQDKSIETQRALAERGLKNTLAFEERRKAELEKKRIEEEKKIKKIKELETFLNSVAEFSKTDPKSAIAKALAQLAIVKAAEATFAEEGGILGKIDSKSTVGLYGFSKRHKSGNDILVHAEKGEGILSRSEISALGGENAFMDLKRSLSLNFTEKKIPALAIMKTETYGSEIVNRLEGVEKAIKNIHFTNISADDIGNIIETNTKNGIKTITKHILKTPRL